MNVDNKEDFNKNIIAPYKASLEEYYIEHRSLGLYFKLIFMTMWAVICPNSKSWRNRLKDLPEVPGELENYI
jgi:lipopolysaccharide/colanic/teichoic acid biosynthesis glycosyltransferase